MIARFFIVVVLGGAIERVAKLFVFLEKTLRRSA
jgi:hypothetical protein